MNNNLQFLSIDEANDIVVHPEAASSGDIQSFDVHNINNECQRMQDEQLCYGVFLNFLLLLKQQSLTYVNLFVYYAGFLNV